MFIRAIAHPRAVFTIVLACLAALGAPGVAGAATLPAGFQQSTPITGLERPMDIELTPAGQVFVAEKSGIVKSFSSLSDPTPTIAADLRTQVHNFSARGLMSLAVDPSFPAQPYIYVYYTLDAEIGGTPPRYGDPDGTWDSCATAPLGLDENCIVGGRISRLRIAGEAMTGSEQVLVEDWCQQYPVHTGGGLAFGADGYLYFTAGDGSTASFWDYGQTGTPPNPCGDPPGTIGSLLTPPTAEGGRLRVQDLRTAGDPTGLDGTLIRIDPSTGAGVAGNPLFDSGSANERRILAYGLRDAVRLAIRPGTNDVWIGDRGGGYWEEFDRVPDRSTVRNFGWPCYEGAMDAQGDPYARIRPRSVEENTNICNGLYAAGNETTAPHWAYDHELPVVPGETCATDALGAPAGSLLSGMSFYPAAGGSFPAPYRRALFFADRLRDCIYALLPGSDGLPERGNVVLFASQAMRPIDLELTTGGDLLYVDQEYDAVQRIRYVGNPANQAPTALATADRTSGPAPLTVRLDGTHSTDPDTHDAFTYEWDLDGDGAFDDSTSARPKSTFRRPGTRSVSLRVTDTGGESDTDTLSIEITEPVTTLTFSPTGDARVEEVHPIDNYGASDKLRAALGPGTESFLRFDLSGINGPVRSARLRLTAATNGTVDGPGVHSVNGAWSESSVNWSNRPAHGSGPVADAGAIASNAKVEYDVTSLVSGDGNGNGTLDLALIATSTDGVEFSSRDHLNAAKRPVLEVTFATPLDTQAPTAPGDLTAQAGPDRIDLSWTASSDNVGVTGYEVYRNGELLAVTAGDVTSYSDTTMSQGTAHEYTVRALDLMENRSEAGNAATATVPDTQAPSAPGDLTAQAGPDRIDLSWTASSDNVGVTGYEVYRNDELLAVTGGDVTSYSDTAVSQGATYQYAVRALDGAGNRSDATDVVTPTVPDTQAPTAPGDLTAGLGGPESVDLSWTASSDNVGVTGYEVYRNGLLLLVTEDVTSYTDATVSQGTTYEYTVRALDTQNRSDESNTATVHVPDTLAPTAPRNLSAQPGSWRFDLSWTASSDNVGVTGYEVYRDGQLVAVIGNVTSYADTTVIQGRTYQYAVRALDGAQNRSDASDTLTVTLADTHRPTAPGSLAAQAAGPTRVDLSWTASSDNLGVTGYEIYRNGLLLVTTGKVTSHSDATVSGGTTYQYTVRALDLAGNRSAASNTASVTPPLALSPVADARVEEARKNFNYGSSDTLTATTGTGPRSNVESYLRFQVSGINAQAKRVKLVLSATTATMDGPGVHSAASTWTESTLKWSNKPARGATPVADKGAITAGATVEYDVTPLVVANGAVSFALVSTSAAGVDFASREFATAARRPLLIIEY